MSVQERPLPASEVTGQAGERPKEIGKGRGFRPDIQGMRAIAVLMVVIYHLNSSWLPGGFAGVDVFFVISGFLITGHLLREYQKTRRVHLLAFWGRRAKRLVPAAVVVLTATWLLSRLVLPATRLADTAAQIRASALYYQNWQLAWNAVDYLKSADAASPVQHFWSLSVEEQFYLGWPLLFLLAAVVGLTARRGSRRVRGHYAAIALACAVVAGSLWYSVYDTNAHPANAYFVTTTRIWELGLGGLLALLPAAVTRRAGRLGALGWAGLGLVIVSAFVLSGTTAFPGALALLPAGGAALLILGGSAEGRFGPHRLTSVPPMVFTGGISYSLYLWHWPLIVLWMSWRGQAVNPVSAAGIVAVAVGLSWLTKVWVEDRVRTASFLAGHNWRSVSTALVAAVPVVLVSIFLATATSPWDGKLGPGYPGAAMLAKKIVAVKPRPVLPPPARLELPAYWRQGCLVPVASPTPKECDYGDLTHPTRTVVLAGDSMAGNWFAPLQAIALKRHWHLITELHSVCPLSAAMLLTPETGGPYTPCHDWGKAVMHDLVTRIKPDVVITSEYPLLTTVKHPEGGKLSAVEIGKGMAKYWKLLERHGIAVVAIKETPLVGRNMPECVSQNPTAVSVCDVPRSKAVRRNLPAVFAVRASHGKVPLIDMDALICGPVDCMAVVGNVLVYQDTHHLTSTYALTTAPYLERRLLKASKTLAKKH